MKQSLTIMLLLSMNIFVACDHHNDFIHWSENIKTGTDINEVKNNQPDFIEIDWRKPATTDTISADSILSDYAVTKIKGNHDMLRMTYTLQFLNNKYFCRAAHK